MLLHNLQTSSTVNTGNFKTTYNDGSAEHRKWCLQMYTYYSYYVQNSRDVHPHNQHIQQLSEAPITAVESRRAHSGQLSTTTGNVISTVSKLSTFMQGKDLILRVIRLSPACQRPACTRVSRPLTWANKHMYVNVVSCVKRVTSKCAKRTLWPDSRDHACLSADSCSLVWTAAIRIHAEIIGKTDSNNWDLASGGRAFYEQCLNWRGQRADKQ
jgi:hypothetical protein